jgi:hypothetical protein
MPKKKKRGGQRKPASRKKTAYLQIRANSGDIRRYRMAADEAGLSLSAWARVRLMNAAKREETD